MESLQNWLVAEPMNTAEPLTDTELYQGHKTRFYLGCCGCKALFEDGKSPSCCCHSSVLPIFKLQPAHRPPVQVHRP